MNHTLISQLRRKMPLPKREAVLFPRTHLLFTMPELYDAKEIKAALKEIPEWDLDGKSIERTFEFDDFSEAIDFVNGVAELAEEMEHHPDIDIRYTKVRLALSTHSKGGLTELDFDLAERIGNLVDA
jgi:4a-hydroxytetrahydrobiopterin dehydratase